MSFLVTYDLIISDGSHETVGASQPSIERKKMLPAKRAMELHATLVRGPEIWVLVSHVWHLMVMRFVRGEEAGDWTLAASAQLRGSDPLNWPLAAELVEKDGTVTAAMDYGRKGKYEARLAATEKGIDVEVVSQPE